MNTDRFGRTPRLHGLQSRLENGQAPRFAIGERVRGLDGGIVVDIDEDAVVVARRNAAGRCTEIVFVGDAARMLRSA